MNKHKHSLKSSALLLSTLFTGLFILTSHAEVTAEIISTKVICQQPGRYIGWPTIAATEKGELLAVFSGDRDEHVCPWGKTQMVRSTDGGTTWTEPTTINCTPLDDRDAGIIRTAKGTMLVNWFTSLAFDSPSYAKYSKGKMDWKRHAEKLTPEIRKQWLGNWMRRSTDGGKTWEKEYIDTLISSPHGPAQMKNGNLIHVGKNSKVGGSGKIKDADKKLLAAAVSTDDGRSWKISGYIPVPKDVKPGASQFHEPHVVEASNGTLIAMFRHHGNPGHYYLWQTASKDGGHTWTELHQTPIWGYPPHLIRLNNGWLLVVYGRRKAPFGERACISRDNGKTWDVEHEITLTDAPNSDLGYPASVQLKDGSIITVYYQQEKAGEKTCLMSTHWRIKE